jgi:hypothetical protein
MTKDRSISYKISSSNMKQGTRSSMIDEIKNQGSPPPVGQYDTNNHKSIGSDAKGFKMRGRPKDQA